MSDQSDRQRRFRPFPFHHPARQRRPEYCTHTWIALSNELAEGEIHFVDKNKNSKNTTTASA